MGFKFDRQNDRRTGTGLPSHGTLKDRRVGGQGAIADGTDVLEDHPHIIGRDQLIPRIIKRAQNAVHTDNVRFYFYHRKHVGRRCSCWDIETPDGHCSVCFGTGIVGGYTKFGTIDHTIDVTASNLRCVNVAPNFDGNTRPVMFELIPSATSGYLEADIEIKQNNGELDVSQWLARYPEGSNVTAQLKGDADVDFVELLPAAIEERLDNDKLTIRFNMTRSSPDAPIPILIKFFLRYKTMDDTAIQCDVPRQPESLTLAEFGVFESFQSIQIYVPNIPPKITTEDFVHRIDTGRRFKITEANPNMPLGRLTSHDLTAKLIQRFERNYMDVPVWIIAFLLPSLGILSNLV